MQVVQHSHAGSGKQLKAPHYLVFAMSSSRTDDSVVEEIQDALDDYLEDEWEIVSWRRSAGTRFIIRATVQARMVQSDTELKLRMMTLSHLMDEMSTPSVEWLIPSKTKIGEPHEMAQRIVEKWLSSLWTEDGSETTDDDDSTKTEVKDDEPEQKKPVKSFIKKSAQQTVLEAFGLTGDEVTEDGKPLSLFTINQNA